MIQLIQAATFSQSKQQRSNAEKVILDHRQANPTEFFQEVIVLLKDSSTAQNIRQAAGTIFLVSILAKKNNMVCYWDTLEGFTKQNLKNAVLEVLIDPIRNVRRAAANIVSAICFLELPRNEWKQIVENICQNANNQDQIVKQASILTLGFICSRMKDRNDFAFELNDQKNILGGIIIGIQQSDEMLIKTALQALRDSLTSFREVLADNQIRNFLLDSIGNMLNSGKFTIEALQIFGEFAKSAYPYLAQYIAPLYQILQPFILNTADQEICTAAMQVWENVAAEEKQNEGNQQKIITGEIGTKIVTLLLKNLYIVENDDLEDNLISDSASKALETIFDLGSGEYKDLVLTFVGQSISKNDWRYRQASIKAFSLVLLGLSDQENQNLIESSIHQIMALLGDSSIAVQYATLESLVIISEVCGSIILTQSNFINYLKVIFEKINVCEKFLRSGCKIIDFLCEADKQKGLGKFNVIADDIIGALLQLSLNENTSRSMISWSISSVMSVIEVSHNEIVARKYINFVLQNFKNLGTINDGEKRETLACAFFTIIQYCLHSLKNKNMETNVLENIYTMVTHYFNAKSDVTPDGIYAIEALVSFFPDTRIVQDFWKYIEHALKKVEDSSLFRATIICITAFTYHFKEMLAARVKTYLPVIIDYFKNSTFNRDLKLDCLLCIGEGCLHAPEASLEYLPQIIEVIISSCEGAILLADSDFSYSESLKQTIIECLECITHGFTADGSKISQALNPYIHDFMKFGAMSLEKKFKPTNVYFHQTLLLLADLCKFYPAITHPLKRQFNLLGVLNTFKDFNKDNNNYASSIRYIEQQLKS